jgi:YD repeat-containing protein
MTSFRALIVRAPFLPVALLSLLATSAFADTATRTSAFEYDASTGLLVKEIIEPDNAALCLVTTYTYDAYGNKVSATTSNCSGATGDAVFTSRASTTSFAATTANPVAGQFPTASTNALGHQEQKEYDAKFGTLTKLTGPNVLITQWTYDAFGRKASEARADGTSTSWAYTLCGTCPTNGKYYVTETSTGAPAKSVYYDSLNREIRAEVQGFDGGLIRKDTEYDALGRVLRVSQPYIAGQAIYWTAYGYDILGRVLTKTDPNNAVSNVTYNGLTITTTNALGQTETRVKNSQGQLIRVTRQ